MKPYPDEAPSEYIARIKKEAIHENLSLNRERDDFLSAIDSIYDKIIRLLGDTNSNATGDKTDIFQDEARKIYEKLYPEGNWDEMQAVMENNRDTDYCFV